MQSTYQSGQFRQGLRPVETVLAGDLAQGLAWQRLVQHGCHAGRLQSVILQDLQGRHAEPLQFDGIVDEAFRVRPKQGG
ncbi:hypothetical protein D3C76_1499960 [compost metagenome]